jgi:cbb3-type cytochrome c oxidase subunit III
MLKNSREHGTQNTEHRAGARIHWLLSVLCRLSSVFVLHPSGTTIPFALFLLVTGCRQDMHDQPKYRPGRASTFFADGRASRPLVADTVARGHLDDDALLVTGKSGDAFADQFPFPVTREVLHRGQERYNIFCSPCHDRVGTGGGMIVLRGYRRPPAFHIDRLRQQPAGYFFDVITRGFGVMPSYAEQIPVRDRWAIIAYVRALQLSQHATLDDVPAPEREQLKAGKR